MNFFFFGMGYSALATARDIRHHIAADIPVAGTTRSRDGVEAFADTDYRIHVFDGRSPGATLVDDLARATHVVISAPPDERGDPVLEHHRDALAASGKLKWLCYYSTVGVYGNFGGAWIDETAETNPVNDRSKLRVTVENQWRAFAETLDIPLLTLRLAGIYGPGRSAFDKLRDGTARRIVKPNQVFNRIHVEDIARVTRLAAERELAGTFNLCDDVPAPPQELVAHAAGLMGVEPPPETPFETARMTPMARSFYMDNKRVSNRAIKQALGIEMLYPSYREGLAAIYEQHA